MHYKLGRDIIIKTENAAKPDSQGSQYLKSFIAKLNSVSSTFDYGCGKLRYKDAILDTTDTLVLVDSEIQLARHQMLCGKATNIRALARRANHLTAYNSEEFGRLPSAFDRAFCINVLSVIPFYAVRKRVLKLIRTKLRTGGTCLFVVQYRNSDFTRMGRMRNAKRWQDGYLINSLRGYSFYGLISPDRLKALVASAGFEIEDCTLNEGSAILTARSPERPRSSLFDIDERNNFRFL